MNILILAASYIFAASAYFFVVKAPVKYHFAYMVCKNNDGHLARLKSEPDSSNMLRATRALERVDTPDAWVSALDGSTYKLHLYLEKPLDFAASGREGDVWRAACDKDGVYEQKKSVLCYKKSAQALKSEKAKGKTRVAGRRPKNIEYNDDRNKGAEEENDTNYQYY